MIRQVRKSLLNNTALTLLAVSDVSEGLLAASQEVEMQEERIRSFEEISSDRAEPLPQVIHGDMADGTYRYSEPSVSIHMGLKKEGDKYYIYDYDNRTVSRALTEQEVNETLERYFYDGTENFSFRKRQADGEIKKAAVVIEADSELARRIETSSKSKYTIIRDYLVEKFGGHKFVLSDGRKAIMDKRDAQELSHKANSSRVAQLGNLKKIVETAQHSHSDMNVEHNKFSAFHYYAIDVTYGKDTFPLWINVGVAKNDGTNHIYAITNRTEETPTHYGVSRPVGYAIQNASSTDSISQEAGKSNSFSEKNFETAKKSDVNAKNTLHDKILKIDDMVPESADALIRAYSETSGISAQQYARAVELGYLYGAAGIRMDQIPQATEFWELSESQRRLAYELGSAVRAGKDAAREQEVRVQRERSGEKTANPGELSKTAEKEKITVGMSEGERAKILRSKRISPAPVSKNTDFDMDSEVLETKDWTIAKKLKKPIVQKLRELGYLKNYKTEAIDIDFEFTGSGALKSANSQILDYGGSLGDFAKVVMNLQAILDRAVLLEIHTDKAAGTSKENSRLLQTYVLLGAFQEGNFCTPVQFEIKQYTDNRNRLYLAVALTKIETGVVSDTAPQGEGRTRLLPVSDYSITELVQKVNTTDENFFKYIPDEFLMPEQIEAKRRALAKEAKKYGTVTASEAISKTGKTAKRQGTVTVKADESTLSERQKVSAMCLRSLSKAIGVNFVVEKLSTRTATGRIGENGRFDHKTNTVYIDLNAGNDGEGVILFTASHELTHFIAKWSPAKYKVLRETLFEFYGQTNKDVIAMAREQMAAAKEAGHPITFDAAIEEVVADAMERMLTDGNAQTILETLEKKDKSIVEKIKDYFRDLLAKIRRAYEGAAFQSDEAQFLHESAEAVERVQALFFDALSDAGETYRKIGDGVVNREKNSFSFRRYAEDGKGIYESNFPKGTPKSAKSEKILQYIKNVWSKKPIRLVISNGETSRAILAQFDPTIDESQNTPTDASKLAGGNRHGNHTEQRVTLDLADDYYKIASEAKYNYSKLETGKKSETHDNVNMWHYFVNDIYFAEIGAEELSPYTVTINVKEKESGDFVYSFNAEKESSTRRTLHADVNTYKGANGELFLDNSIPENAQNVNSKSENNSHYSLRKPGRAQSSDRVTVSRGTLQKQKADYTSDRVYSKKDVLSVLSGIEGFRNMPADIRVGYIDEIWRGLNAQVDATHREAFIEVVSKRFTHDLEAEALGEDGERIFDDLDQSEIDQIKDDAELSLHSLLDLGKPSIRAKMQEEFDMSDSGRYKRMADETNERATLLGHISTLTQKMKDLKLGVYVNATQDKSELFKGSVEGLAKIQWNGNLSVKLAWKHIGALRDWYTTKNEVLCYRDNDHMRFEKTFG